MSVHGGGLWQFMSGRESTLESQLIGSWIAEWILKKPTDAARRYLFPTYAIFHNGIWHSRYNQRRARWLGVRSVRL